MAETDLERLVVTLEAQSVKLDRSITASSNLVDKKLAAIERRTEVMRGRVQNSFGGAAAGITSAMGTIGIALSAASFLQFARDTLAAVQQLKDLSDQSGLSTDTLQGLQYAGIKAGISLDDINRGALMFNKTLGDFLQNQGGPGAVAFEKLGIKARLAAGEFHSTQDVFKAVVQQMYDIKDGATQAAVGAELFGRFLGPKLVPLIKESGGSIDKLVTSAKDAGVVLGDDLVNSADAANIALNTLFFTIEQDGTKAIASISPEIKSFTTDIQSNIGAVNDIRSALGRWYDWLTSNVSGIASTFATIGKAAADAFNPLSAAWSFLKERLNLGYGKLSPDESRVTVTPMRTAADLAPALKLGAKPGAGDTAKAEADARKKALDQLLALQQRANADQLSAQDRLNIQLLVGHVAHYAAVIKQINDEKQEKIAAVAIEEKSEIDSLDRLKGLTAADRDRRIGIIKEITRAKISAAETDARIATEEANRAIKLDEMPHILAEVNKSTSNSIELADQLRSGLENVASSGVDGFKSMRSAAGDFVKTLAQLIIKLYVMKPLMDSLLGQSGTPIIGGGQAGKGGGLIGSLLSGAGKLFDGLFDDGGTIAPGHFGIKSGKTEIIQGGTSGVSVMPVASVMNIPRAVARSGSSMRVHLTTTVSLAGANGDKAINDASRQAALSGAQAAIKHIETNFPDYMGKTLRDRG